MNWVIALLCALCSSLVATEPTTTQKITLTAGWNLLSVQVGNGPIPVSTFQSSLSTPGNLIEIWSYTPSGNLAVPGVWQSYQPLVPSFPSDLAAVVPGKCCWVNLSQDTDFQISGVPWNGTVNLVKGWNLVGFPGVSLDENEVQELSAVFGSSFDRIQQVWTFDTTLQRFRGYDLTAIPAMKDLTGVSPGKGYWVYSISDTTISLTPQPFVALPSDSDASPPQAAAAFQSTDPRWLGSNPAKYVGKQVRYRAGDGSDTPYDLNANGVLDDPYTQDTILFEKTADTVSITIGNNGSGLVTWSLENTCDWLYSAPADARTWPSGATTRPRNASGTVSSEKDTLLLYADRTGMTPGRKTGSITLWVGGQAFPVSLLLDVATVDGDWRGFATTTRVGGRNISLGEVRLVLNSFSINNNEANGFRAVLNREQSILFPRDVYMDGVFYASNQFKLTTNFEMKAGDRNAPPYDVFPGDAKDRDTNGDGKVDVMNPFPYGIRREVTLLGTRVSPDRLEGTYIESIRGMLPPLSGNTLVTDQNQFVSDAFLTQSQPVFIEGTFVLERQSFTPTQRSVFNESADLGLNIGGSDTTSRSVTFDVTTPVTVQGVTLSLNLTFPDPALLQISLIGPNPNDNPYIIHEFGDNSAIPSSLVIPANAFTGAGNGTWTLVIEWDGSTGERGTLASWGLNIEGASTHQATGRIVASAVPVAGATIRLEGGVTTQTFTAAANGTFTIPSLTENDYTLYISKPGYQTTTVTFFVSETDVALGDLTITPLAITQPQLTAAPPIGYAGTQPLHVEFTVDLPLGFGGTTVAWDFNGDNVTDQTGPIATLTETSFDYATPGIYTAKVTFSGSSVGAENTFKTQTIHVHRGTADPAGGNQQILVNAFVGAFGALTDVGSASPAASPAAVTEVQTQSVSWLAPAPVSLTSGFVYQESIWDSATFDLDRIPVAPGTAFGSPEDIDLTLNWPSLRYVRFNTNSPNPTKYEALTYVQTPTGSRSVELNNTVGFTPYAIPSGSTKPNRFRIATALGGSVFATSPSAVGDIKIQPGRTLP
ncbi:MAG: carboxypeptidase regulatory-like domain-containing protein [Verrucomicrobiaceae bacterium]|nr:carboxypeptidase regulatory-like domain-containing protein [Verrucomicrobiaceae bacterium]